MGLEKSTIHTSASGWSPAYALDNLAVMSIGFMLPNKSDAVIWRGPKKNGLIKQFLKDVEWGDLDYLVVDTPPGTSDEHLSIVQYLKEAGIDGAVLITTPQEVALQDVRKEIDFCRKVGIPILGIVENMSGFVCPSCKGESEIFIPSTGGAQAMADELGIELLGKLPLDPRIGMTCDRGMSFLDEFPESPATVAYLDIVDRECARARVQRGRAADAAQAYVRSWEMNRRLRDRCIRHDPIQYNAKLEHYTISPFNALTTSSSLLSSTNASSFPPTTSPFLPNLPALTNTSSKPPPLPENTYMRAYALVIA